ncbi:LOW QUALITY PROTEIN: growth-regulating factor 1-like [Salvia splendens]|uniref:LOW QUALITY PROTEIN: growth-regulating factor 1-like n=1 Tax=Salvia splendens TaxID=180675 RepID=UPI001C267142|nr:LOW QUALITY PROTEIN: growth-regulating factor 1-like [Salvia splendens]
MDFGVLSHKQNAGSLPSAEPRDEHGHESVNQRSQDCWKSHKILKPSQPDFSPKMASDAYAAFGRSNLWPPPPDDGQKMLSFSSPAPPDAAASARSIAFSICQDQANAGNGGSGLRGSFSRLKGPFTPSQWMDLEHQALIYKHIVANVPVPSNLLAPLKRSLYSYGSPASYASNFLGWGGFHLGFSGSNDPEPGRCRRTDGKKWRCSRDAVPDQKYCERHINRGRHRSRKPVEGHTGHAVSGSAASKVASVASSSSASAMSTSNVSNSLSAMQHQLNSLQPNAASADHLVSRAQDVRGLSLLPPTIGAKSKDAPYTIQKQHFPFEESSHLEFGSVSSDCLLNPSEKISYMNGSNSDSFNTKEANNSQHPVHHFIDDWPKYHQSDRASGSWPEELKSDWTQLSMSIPIAPDFSSSTGSPTHEKSTLSTLRLSHEVDPTRMSLGVSHDLGQPVEKESPWSPISWGNSMGGPLGEVLTSSTSGGAGTSFSSVNISPQLGLSPTGVLQKSTLVSLSNSSSGGSRTNAGNKALCNELPG